jgi:molybdopterin molybdotransferase
MAEFLTLVSPQQALATLLASIPDRKPAWEVIRTAAARGRVIAEEIRSPNPLPEFTRSTVDGYAVHARDTFGTSESLPGYLNLVGEVQMGEAPSFTISPGECGLIHTGGMLPCGANAVIMLEYTQPIHKKGTTSADLVEIEISRACAEGENVIHVGEDVKANQVVIAKGVRIRPAEIGGCMALGIMEMRVAIKPMIGILSTGDEVVPPGQKPHLGQVRDVNTYSLAAVVEEAGGTPINFGIIPDNLQLIQKVAREALKKCEMVLITAGSSASVRDMTAETISSLGKPGVLVHGVNVRPGKPTILGVCDGKAMIGLPGNPVSALVIARLFVVPVIEKLLGAKHTPKAALQANLVLNVASQAGREEWIAVKLSPSLQINEKGGNIRWLAEPLFAKSNLIFSLVFADGLICIPADATGISAGEKVEVMLL